jgi:tetratricopeptide (TPR) repeat protein
MKGGGDKRKDNLGQMQSRYKQKGGNMRISSKMLVFLIVALGIFLSWDMYRNVCLAQAIKKEAAMFKTDKAEESQLDLNSQLNKLRQGMQQGNIQASIDSAEALLKKYPNNAEVVSVLCEGYIRKKDFSRAEAQAEKIIATNPKSAIGYQMLTQRYRAEAEAGPIAAEKRQELLLSAQKEIEKALQLDPDNPWVNVEAALTYSALVTIGKGEFKNKALETIRKAYNIKPDDSEIKKMKEQVEAILKP